MGWISWILPVLGAVAICVMCGVTIGDILLRALFNKPIKGSYEIVQLCLATAIYAGIGETFRRGVNITVDLIDLGLPRLSRVVLLPLGNILSFVVIAVFLFGSIRRSMVLAEYGDVTIDLKLSVVWYWVPVITGLAWALICIVRRLYVDIMSCHTRSLGERK